MFPAWLAKAHRRVSQWLDPEPSENLEETISSESCGEECKAEKQEREIIEIEDDSPQPPIKKTAIMSEMAKKQAREIIDIEDDSPQPVLLSAVKKQAREIIEIEDDSFEASLVPVFEEEAAITPEAAQDDALVLNKYYNSNLGTRLLTPLLGERFKAESAWFNDIIVNDYFLAITEHHSSLYCLDSMYVNFKHQDFFERLKKNIRLKQRIENNFKQADLIFWPIPMKQHWYLFIIDKSKVPVHFYVLDGMNEGNTREKAFLNFGIKILESLQPELLKASKQNPTLFPLSVPPQKNTYDCGSVICWWGQKIADHFKRQGTLLFPDNQSVDYSSFRATIARSLINEQQKKVTTVLDQSMSSSVLGKRTRDHIR